MKMLMTSEGKSYLYKGGDFHTEFGVIRETEIAIKVMWLYILFFQWENS